MVELSVAQAKAFAKYEKDQDAKKVRGKGRRLAMGALKAAHKDEWEALKIKHGVKKA